MRYLLILLMCFSTQVLAHYDDPEPSPVPKQTQTPVSPKSHDDTGKAFMITVVVGAVVFWAYCHFSDKCHDQKQVTDDDLNVTPKELRK